MPAFMAATAMSGPAAALPQMPHTATHQTSSHVSLRYRTSNKDTPCWFAHAQRAGRLGARLPQPAGRRGACRAGAGGDLAGSADLHVVVSARVHVPRVSKPWRADVFPRSAAGGRPLSRTLSALPRGLSLARHRRGAHRLELQRVGTPDSPSRGK